MSEANYSHQEGLFDPSRARKVTLLGAGSVGSHVAYLLAKMGVNKLEVWDADSVSSHNSPMSLYGPQDVGRYKVDALAELLERLTGVVILPQRKKYEGEELRNTTVVACVDTMAARKSIWERVKMTPSVDIFCDTRTAGWYVEVLAVSPCDPEDIKNYEALLYKDKEAARQLCGRHGVAPVAVRAAQIVASILASFWQGGYEKKWRIGERCDTLQQVF